ncbi:hypothetical protein S40293_00805 [Stachybotrys chartarum IBT 40293]|nr:hypothetical protein S40293_00805 [Stachybotrys chartarum IBT 40293]KFA76347.1 hypothetical protein S40288_02968 [Stachybotrys chartarum IBT 40288]
MPRIPPWLLRQAKRCSPEVASLLPACKDIPSALNEVRWLREHVERTASSGRRRRLAKLCIQRGRGVPLQYLLGSQPFGPLDIKCKPGVLIPRPETEAYAYRLADLIKPEYLGKKDLASGEPLSIVDFCTGTGCIPLLLFALLQRAVGSLDIRGVDISTTAVQLAECNAVTNIRDGHLLRPGLNQRLAFTQGDVFGEDVLQSLAGKPWDVLVANPPYISEDAWKYGRGHLTYSVRKYEPRLALVPPDSVAVPTGWHRQDVFYCRLLDIAHHLGTRIVLLEVGDEAQAIRVLQGLANHRLKARAQVEAWRDYPHDTSGDSGDDSLAITTAQGRIWTVPTRGSGLVRSILLRLPKAT